MTVKHLRLSWAESERCQQDASFEQEIAGITQGFLVAEGEG